MHSHSRFRLIPLALLVASFPTVHATSGAGLRLSPLVFVLDPPSAKYFTLCCVFIGFASLASFQAIRSLFIIYRRLCQSHEATTGPDPSGLLFPLFLALSAVLLTITLILDATDINGVPTPPRAFLSTISMVACLADIFLVSSLLALLSHRQSVTFRSTGILSKVKPTIDIFLMLTLVGLSMSSSWVIVDAPPMLRLVNKLILAYVILLLMATLDVMISSIGLHVCMRRTALSNAVGLFVLLLPKCSINPAIRLA